MADMNLYPSVDFLFKAKAYLANLGDSAKAVEIFGRNTSVAMHQIDDVITALGRLQTNAKHLEMELGWYKKELDRFRNCVGINFTSNLHPDDWAKVRALVHEIFEANENAEEADE